MREALNEYGRTRKPCLFVIDFDRARPFVCGLERAADERVYYSIRGQGNRLAGVFPDAGFVWRPRPVSFAVYENAFCQVQDELRRGNTYLVNLTFPTPVETNLGLLEIFDGSRAPYKLYFKDRFVSYSPEEFVTIRDNAIRTCPMKGTIRSDIPGAREKILNDIKETAEHVTVVDLLRNDLGMVSRGVTVERWRYLDEVRTGAGALLQVSTAISGRLDPDWPDRLGDILSALLPAGSVTGAPKKKTVEIIRRVETYERGYYTGIFGVFDGREVKSGVLIRFLERAADGGLAYKSGGGITIDSRAADEYRELVEKVYVPVAGDD
jgi:para-aminobenzoate synthetase component I